MSAELYNTAHLPSLGLRVQDLDRAVLTDCQLLEKLLQFADKAVRLLTIAQSPEG